MWLLFYDNQAKDSLTQVKLNCKNTVKDCVTMWLLFYGNHAKLFINPSEIKKNVENVHQWLRCNKLTLNKDKTEFMIIASKYRLKNSEGITDISLALGDNNIKRVNNKKSLGFIIDQLKWGTHIDTQCKKITKNIAILRRDKPYASLHALIKTYNALVLPHLTYFSTIWNDGSNKK